MLLKFVIIWEENCFSVNSVYILVWYYFFAHTLFIMLKKFIARNIIQFKLHSCGLDPLKTVAIVFNAELSSESQCLITRSTVSDQQFFTSEHQILHEWWTVFLEWRWIFHEWSTIFRSGEEVFTSDKMLIIIALNIWL